MDRVAAVQALSLSESDAIIQANLVAYVDDRETYDLTDGEQRINSVLERSNGDAARTLRDLWTSYRSCDQICKPDRTWGGASSIYPNPTPRTRLLPRRRRDFGELIP